MSTIIGIDLGTSTTEAAVYRNGKVEMILNFDHEAITPSAVGIDNGGNWVVGSRALAQYILSPENTAIEVKRKIGTEQMISIGKKTYTPVALSGKILDFVKTYATEYLGEDIKRAVISVPAYFNETQRLETIKAGRVAGFQVERILNEPTAAALSYGLDHMDEESHILVYDLGGGTFDVTLLEMFDGVLEVKASAGDNQLGGKDFDEKIMDWLIRQFQNKHGVDLRTNRYAMVKLKEEAEHCKKALSKEDSYQILIPAIATVNGQPVELDETLTRAAFEKMVAGLIERTHGPIDVVLADSGISAANLDRIILVGGSTRMPIVARDIEAYLGKAPDVAVNPDFAVSEGAAIQAAIISGEIDPNEGLIMTDVNPFSLGISCINNGRSDYFSVLIPRNTTIPTTRKGRYYTCYPGQTEVKIEAYQGESAIASHNHYLGEFMLSDIPANYRDLESLDVEFSYDINGLLNVEATVISTGKSASISIDMHGKTADTEYYEDWKESPLAADYRAIIRRAERALKRIEDDEDEEEFASQLNDALEDLKRCISANDDEGASDAEDSLTSVLGLLED